MMHQTDSMPNGSNNRLLLNGCSFTQIWQPTEQFVSELGCDETINIAIEASSFQRTCRSTIEWIAQNGNPYCVVIPITYTHRWELAVGQEDHTIDGTWFPLQRRELLTTPNRKLDPTVDKDKLGDLLDLYYGCNPTIRTYWDKTFNEIIMLSSFLENRKIKYIMFDMCNDFKQEHINGFKGFKKLDLIKSNNNIIDLFSFCGNKHMWQSMEHKTQEFNLHHESKQYLELESYITAWHRNLHS